MPKRLVVTLPDGKEIEFEAMGIESLDDGRLAVYDKSGAANYFAHWGWSRAVWHEQPDE